MSAKPSFEESIELDIDEEVGEDSDLEAGAYTRSLVSST